MAITFDCDMVKFVLLLLGVWLLITLLKGYRRNMGTPPESANASKAMVRCAVCGVHLPEDESIARDGIHYCCMDHRDQAGA